MIKRFYYSLNEAASILSIDIETIYQNAIVGNIALSILYNSLPSIIETRDNEEFATMDTNFFISKYLSREGRKDIDFGCYYLDKNSIKLIFDEGIFKSITDFENGTVNLLQGQMILDESKYNGYYATLINFGPDISISIDDLVITHEEIERIKFLKAQIEGQPTLEQVQAENEALKQRITELEAQKCNNNSELAPKSKTSINAFLSALNKAYPQLDVARIIAQSDGNISDKTIYKYLRDGV